MSKFFTATERISMMIQQLKPLENDKTIPFSEILSRTIDKFCDWLSNPRSCDLSGNNREMFLELLKIFMLNPDTETLYLQKIFQALDRDTSLLDEALKNSKKINRASLVLFDFLVNAGEYNQDRFIKIRNS